MAQTIHLKLKSNITVIKLIDRIDKKYRIKKIKSEKKAVTYLDTFDWRLYRNNFILKHENDILQLQKIDRLQSSQKLKLSEIPVFADDIPVGNLRNSLIRMTQIRALQLVSKIVVNCDNYNVLDKNQKIVLRLQIETINRIGKFITITALRGYESQIGTIKSLIKSEIEAANQRIILKLIFKLNKNNAADYDPRIRVQLKPEMQSDEATKLILKNLVETMVKNEQGIIKDIDTEFLHDFRVASRRTRAALTQIKNVFEPQVTAQFNDQFTLLGKKTNKLRDLDVYLLNKDQYIKRLPVNMQKDIESFFDELHNERKTEVRRFVRFLKSESYKNQVKDYIDFLSSRARKSESAFNANKPIKTLAIEFIINRYNKVTKLGNKIKTDSPDALYHKLRIQCKKLRYLLEFFSSLFPQDKISLLIVHLKKLQDNLGLFNDLFVQQERLKNYSQKDDFNTNVILALGYLIGKLNDEQIEVRNNFNNTFKEFSNNKNKKLFNEIFVINRGL